MVAFGRAYRPRVIDAELSRAMRLAGAVVIEGPRGCGKTMTGLNAAASAVFVDDPEVRGFLAVSPRSLLDGAPPRLIDEWQLAPELWNLVRRAVDAAGEPGRFVLTGSAVPADDVTRHSGAGRFLRLRERTMTWWEQQNMPSGGVSLSALFAGDRPEADIAAAPSLHDTVAMVLRSGFPAWCTLSAQDASILLRGYAEETSRTDVAQLAAVRHEPGVITQLLQSLARNVATDVGYSTLARDVRTVAPAISEDTIANYVALLRRLFVVETQPAWTPKLNSRARLRVSARLHLADAALAAALIGADEARLLREMDVLGHLFESAAVHDLMTLVSPFAGEVRHYRDSSGNEIDAVLVLPGGRWAAVEVKLGGRQLAAGIDSLTKACAQIDTAAAGQPAFRLVITGTGPILTASDGTVTCPLAALRP
jgi:predicted AAA+ superfamily ATPase